MIFLTTQTGRAFTLLFFFWVFFNPSSAAITNLRQVYFNSGSSLVLELETQAPMEPQIQGSKIILNGFRIKPTTISNDKYRVSFKLERTQHQGFWQPKDSILVEVFSLDPALKPQISFSTILDKLVYQINFDAMPEEIKAEDSPKNNLSATINQISTLVLTHTNDFIQKLDPQIQSSLGQDASFQEINSSRLDSVSLSNIASSLQSKGLIQESKSAYQEALGLDSNNLIAHLGLARISEDPDQKIQHYLAGIETNSLIELGDLWFGRAYQSKDFKSANQALIPFQMAVLKDPKNPEFRFKYAKALESLGNFKLSSKRYLEAAALSKGNNEILLRESTEALIKVLTLDGASELASKYCDSYLGMGYQRFLDGKPILTVRRQIQARLNPFEEKHG